MKISCASLVVSALAASSALAATVDFPSGLKNLTNSDSFHMTTVRVVQARVQSDKPAWNTDLGAYVSKYYTNATDAFVGVLDTVNTASVEGALMYVQAEGINVNEQSVKCQRKNNMQYIWFYEITVAQPNATLAYYANKQATLEYCPFAAMDGGKCTPSGTEIPDVCKQYDGIQGQPKLGHCVGAGEQTSDPRAPYPGNYWYSYPNSCVNKVWADKTDECRTEFAGGLCAAGVVPDGVSCTFNYEVLGYLNIDDLVGITNGSAADGTKYTNYTEFCEAGNIEFSAENTGNGFKVDKSIAFWEDPSSTDANEHRTQTMIDMYNELAPDAETGEMKALPEITTLTKANPPCYKNSIECASAKNGCKRTLYSQLCQVCDSASADCVVAPSDFKYPTLEVPKVLSSTSSGSGSSANSDDVGSAAPGAALASTLAVAAAVATAALL